jgi:DNA-directed RNA polymerase specialized sigma24 family protein
LGGTFVPQSADVFQRVFAKLVERLNQIEQPALLGAWLMTTARHEAWRQRRRERLARAASIDAPVPPEPLADDSFLPGTLVLRPAGAAPPTSSGWSG